MESLLEELFNDFHSLALLGVIAACLLVLGKGATLLVDEAVVLSERLGIPKVIIGATVVSLGTTAPEAAVSVLAAIRGNPGIALGNAVGSIICDTGLILGLACLISPPPLDRSVVNRQGWIQFGAGVLLVLCCWPLSEPLSAFTQGGRLPQLAGIIFLVLLVTYLWWTIRSAKKEHRSVPLDEFEVDAKASTLLVLGKLVLGIAMVVGSSWVLIPAVTVASKQIGVPDAVVAATLVAFGTSLPELVTAVTASLRGHGDLAVGNIVGADILNVLFVAGAAAAVTPGGLIAGTQFFWIYFPCMIAILAVFRIGIFTSRERLSRGFGVVLLAVYLISTTLGYLAK